MKRITVSVGSPTRAIKLRKLLIRARIPSRLVKNSNTSEGCTNGVEIYERDFYSAVVIMKENGIAYTLRQDNDLS